ncbi:hypothetical protein SAMN05421751_106206 [Jhaorihella thermophila]|uniref:Transposase, Mutator family n=1 Tax=Jhaorihella thermophila TaxID=488547 RepID=A0A1H5VS72_9RHOB|nr:hypothetical protein SAMN05421751_106206 [Jhaorihella thermophila]
MTKASLSWTAVLHALWSQSSDTRLLAKMAGFVAERLMALDVDQCRGAGAHEHSADRMNRHNGYRTRAWDANQHADMDAGPHSEIRKTTEDAAVPHA